MSSSSTFGPPGSSPFSEQVTSGFRPQLVELHRPGLPDFRRDQSQVGRAPDSLDQSSAPSVEEAIDRDVRRPTVPQDLNG